MANFIELNKKQHGDYIDLDKIIGISKPIKASKDKFGYFIEFYALDRKTYYASEFLSYDEAMEFVGECIRLMGKVKLFRGE